MRHTTSASFRCRRLGGRARGGAMFEFLLLLICILVPIIGLGIYLAQALGDKHNIMVDTRYQLWRSIYGNWRHDHAWSNDDEDNWADNWPIYNVDANGPIGSGATINDNMPRGEGEEIEYLYANAGSEAYRITSDSAAQDYFRRIWNNLPGRHTEKHSAGLTREDNTNWKGSSPWFHIQGPVSSKQEMDSATWSHGQLPLWIIAQSGPMREINETFHSNLDDVPAEFRRMREEVYHAWFKEEWMPGWNHPDAVIP